MPTEQIIMAVIAIIATVSLWGIAIIFHVGKLIGGYQENQSNMRADIDHLEQNTATKEELRLVQTSHSEALRNLVKNIGTRFDTIEARISDLRRA